MVEGHFDAAPRGLALRQRERLGIGIDAHHDGVGVLPLPGQDRERAGPQPTSSTRAPAGILGLPK